MVTSFYFPSSDTDCPFESSYQYISTCTKWVLCNWDVAKQGLIIAIEHNQTERD